MFYSTGNSEHSSLFLKLEESLLKSASVSAIHRDASFLKESLCVQQLKKGVTLLVLNLSKRGKV